MMPLARIDLVQGKSPEYRRMIGDVVYEAVVSELKAPEGDRFQVITEHPAGDLIADPRYLGINRTADVVFIQVTMNVGRTLEQKKAFYKKIADGLHERLGLRREDVLINLVEVAKENWSFGNAIAQYA
jgi:phenylpyruvate tautomerase PptA (4-oxalocrotonate tautomerase family)